jgi:murein DD-endopeptidase MepM/ murein hydrolase activator NlpD
MAKSAAAMPRKSKKSRSALGRIVRGIFCKRSIIIISDQKTQHVPFAAGTQAVTAVAVIGFVAWAAFSSGSYMAAQQVIDEKERKLATFEQENERVEAEFSLLKQDLMKIAESGKGSKAAEAAKEIVEQYADSPLGVDTDNAASKYDVVFNRIQLLENKVKELQSNHDDMMADIRSTTGGKIKELESVLARTGVDKEALQRSAEAKRLQEEQRREKYGRIEGTAEPIGDGRGGPFNPLPTHVLKEKDAELYFDLRKLVTLNEVVEALPLASPMKTSSYKKTSSFGTRVDPFRGTLAFHSGLDLAGAPGTQIVATNDGRIDFTGWKTAYGNTIDVKHEYGFSTRYAHLSKILVRPGQIVKKGQVIGVQGSTGRSTGNHLHYEVRYNDQPVNPSNFLKAGIDVSSAE